MMMIKEVHPFLHEESLKMKINQSILSHSYIITSGDDEIDVKPFLSPSRDGADMPPEMEETK
jgi:hypothetical protein